MLHAVPKKKRYNKFVKPIETGRLILEIAAYFQCGKREAEAYLALMSSEEIDYIKNMKGGNKEND
jgi:hypothetical protein